MTFHRMPWILYSPGVRKCIPCWGEVACWCINKLAMTHYVKTKTLQTSEKNVRVFTKRTISIVDVFSRVGICCRCLHDTGFASVGAGHRSSWHVKGTNTGTLYNIPRHSEWIVLHKRTLDIVKHTGASYILHPWLYYQQCTYDMLIPAIQTWTLLTNAIR